jgi:hypothetical protein
MAKSLSLATRQSSHAHGFVRNSSASRKKKPGNLAVTGFSGTGSIKQFTVTRMVELFQNRVF